ncbi:hypothetical protein EQV77_13405 [Halobacillus fulvus]|nr:hypothetical protein EQV77_13405 [Halobacillus fulvus]
MRFMIFISALLLLAACQPTYTLEDDIFVKKEQTELNMTSDSSRMSNVENAETANPDQVDDFLGLVRTLELEELKGNDITDQTRLIDAVPSLTTFFLSEGDIYAQLSMTQAGDGLFVSFKEGDVAKVYRTKEDHPEIYEQIERFYDSLYVRKTYGIESFNLEKMVDTESPKENIPDASPFKDGLTVEGKFKVSQENQELKADIIEVEVRTNKPELKLEKSEPERLGMTQFEQKVTIENTVADYVLSGSLIWMVEDYETVDIRFIEEG